MIDLFTTQAQKSKAAIETSTILEASEKGKQMGKYIYNNYIIYEIF